MAKSHWHPYLSLGLVLSARIIAVESYKWVVKTPSLLSCGGNMPSTLSANIKYSCYMSGKLDT